MKRAKRRGCTLLKIELDKALSTTVYDKQITNRDFLEKIPISCVELVAIFLKRVLRRGSVRDHHIGAKR